ncbi:MAG: division/cell wall cluster transcriptional repressor MraZ [Desulfobacterales bacterium]|nr:division/cell wall cluster transcriptional repressor MraZ [Desulfobacterales bacterium]
MFRGSSFHTIDAKGRLIIPARFRDVIRADGGERVMLSRMDGCLVAYPLDGWRRIESRILQLAQKNDSLRRFRRVFIGGAFDCACDKQERILIPPLLRDYAGLQKDVVLVGVLDHFEIWSRGKWEQENLNLEEDLKQEEVRKDIASLGL